MTFAEQIRDAQLVRGCDKPAPYAQELRCPLCHWNYVGDPALAAPRLLLHQTLMHGGRP